MKDIFIISYNEEGKIFNDNDLTKLITEICITYQSPSFIYVATQESRSGDDKHFQHVLRNRLEKYDYQLLHKVDASIFGSPYDKNVRSRIYFNKTKVSFLNEDKVKKLIKNKYITPPLKKSIFNLKKPEDRFDKGDTLSTERVKIENTISKKSEESGFKKSIFNIIRSKKPKFYNGSIYTELIFQCHNKKQYKFIFINSHLFYDKDLENTGLEERKREFEALVKEFDLVNKWNNGNGYNIFFLGDLNFKLFTVSNTKNKKLYFSNIIPLVEDEKFIQDKSTLIQKSIEIIKKFKEYNKVRSDKSKRSKRNELQNELRTNNELQLFLNNKKKNSFYKSLLDSTTILGIYLTNRYKTGISEKDKEKFNKYLKNEESILTHEEYNTIMQKFNIHSKNGYFMIPSQSDVILYALSNIEIKPNDFKIDLLLNKSSHRMISLLINVEDNCHKLSEDITFSLTLNNNNNNNLKSK